MNTHLRVLDVASLPYAWTLGILAAVGRVEHLKPLDLGQHARVRRCNLTWWCASVVNQTAYRGIPDVEPTLYCPPSPACSCRSSSVELTASRAFSLSGRGEPDGTAGFSQPSS